MILEFDLGNTRFKWRLREGQTVILRGNLLTVDHFGGLEASLNLYRAQIKRVLCVSVVSEERELELVKWCNSFLSIKPEFVRVATACAGVVNGYAEPSTLGADRWLGVVCAYNRCHNSFILVSFGTAVTVDLVLRDGRHLGGFIAPGVNLMLDSLLRGTSRVTVDKVLKTPCLQVGTTTNTAVHSALTAMLIGLIDNAVIQIRKMELEAKIDIVFTGGDAEKFSLFYPEAKQMPDLVLDGISYAFNDPKNAEQ